MQGLDGYAYVNNSPTRYVDPSGHDPYWCENSGTPSTCYHQFTRGDAYKRDELFSLTFKGSGKNDEWTEHDWNAYFKPKDRVFYWEHPDEWINPDPSGVEGWAARVKRLASHYGEVETDAFVRDFAFIYAAIPTGGSWLEGALAAIGGPPNDYYIHESNDGLATEYIDSLRDWQNQSHHYAGLFYLGYFGSQAIAETVNCLRDCGDLNFGDINLGITGARDGAAFNGIAPNDLVSLILNLSEFTP